jgi:hypothetical protein
MMWGHRASIGEERAELLYINCVDLGGASVQKSNICDAAADDCQDLQTLYLFGHVYKLTSSSATCFGLVEAMKRFTALLVHESFVQNNKTLQKTIENPCLVEAMSEG